jgi:xanthine dehydrogenase accessory factor
MREIIGQVKEWSDAGKKIALATVIKTWGSSPRKAGAHMAINSEGEFTGSVSGGCIEGAIIEEALSTIRNKTPKLLHFGVPDDLAWDVGLACGGEIDVFILCFEKNVVKKIHELINKDKPFSYSFIIEGPDSVIGDLSVQDDGEIQAAVPRLDIEEVQAGKIKRFINIVNPAPVIIIVGGVHITVKLAQIAKSLDYKTIVIDPRRAFSTEDRFPDIDRLITSWPKEAFSSIELNNSTAVVTLSHDPKIDDPALLAALDSPVFYIGALGSKNTHQERLARLKESGCSEKQISIVKSPVGINIGSQSPAEIALAIMAEIVAVKNGNFDDLADY